MRMCILALALLVSPAWAGVFKCTANGITTYSETPCGDKPKVVELNVHQPSRRDQLDAQQRAQNDRQGVAVVDAQRERLEFERRVERSQRASAEAAHNSKCAGYQRGAKNAAADRDAYYTPAFKNQAEQRRKEYEDAHFSECYAK
jgi:hypothetical protein